MDSLNKLGNEFATDAGSLGEGLKNAASALALGGMDINKSLALLTGGSEITQNAGELGNALKVGQMRVMGMKGALEELGEESEGLESISKIQTHILNITKGQVNIMNSADPTKFRDYYDILENVSKVYDKLDQTKQADLIETLFGKQRGNQGAAVIQAFQSGQVQKALEASMNSAGSAYEEQSRWMESLDAKTQQYSASFQSLSQTVLNSDFLKSLIESGTTFNNVLTSIIQTIGLFPSAIGAIGLGAFVKNFQDLKNAGAAAVAMKELNAVVDAGATNFSSLANILKTVDTQTKISIVSQSALSKEQKIMALTTAGVSAEEIKAAISTGTLSTAETTAKVSTIGFTTALKGLWTTMLANPLLAVGMAVTAGIAVWNAYKQSVEDMRQKTSEATSSFTESSKSIEDYASKYKTLRDELLKANTTEERQHEIKKDLLTLQNELNDKYGEEHGKINLVTDAYKDQTQAIKDLNKETAQKFLNENTKGLDDAESQMTSQKGYNIFGQDVSMYSDQGKDILDVAKRLGLKTDTDESTGSFTIRLKADPTVAYKQINDFMNEVTLLQEKYGKNDSFITTMLGASSSELNKAKSIIDDFGEKYNSRLIAEIQASDSDMLSEGYAKAKTAVDEYNEAVSSGDESKIEEARNSLNDVKSSIDLTSDDWKRYGGIMTSVFDQASTGLYDFRDAINSNQDGIKSLTNDLNGLSKEDLLSMADDGQADNFDKLVESGKKYGLTAEDVITVLQKLKVVQDEVAESGEQVFTPLSKEDVISNINSLSSGFESLDKIMNSMKDKNPFNYALLDDKNFKDTFSGLGEDYTKFIEAISSSPNDVKATQSAFDSLVTTWIDNSGVLNNLTEDNSNLAVSMLKNMGVANAEEVVMSRLTATQEHLAAQKAYTVDMSDALSNATASEIPRLIDEATQSDIARVAIAGLALAKMDANGTALDTSGDIENVQSLIGIIGSANVAINAFNRIKAGDVYSASTQKTNRDNLFSSNTTLGLNTEIDKQIADYNNKVTNAKSAAEKEIQDAIKTASEYKGQGTKTNFSYAGGTKTNKPSSSGSGSKDKTKKDFSEIFDWIQVTIDRVNEKIDKLKDKISDANGWKTKNQITGTALDEMSTKVTALESQLATYQGKLKEAGDKLNETYIGKIKDGTMEVETVTDEVISKNIKEYQDWYGKINDVNKELDNTKKSMQELAKSRLDNILNDFDSLTSLMGKYSSYSNNLLNLQKSLGEEISNSDYEQLISQQEAIYNQLQNEYSSLNSELTNAVGAGTIKVGDEAWRKYNGELIDVKSSMNDAVSSMNDFRKALMDLPFEQLQNVASEFDRLNSGMDTMINVMGSSGTTLDGMVTAKGLAQIALYGKQYANSKQLAAEYANAIDELNNAYENGSLTQAEYNDKLNEFTSTQQSAVKATKEAEDAILQFRKTAIQEQIDDYNKLIEAKKKARDEDDTYKKYLEEVAEKQKEISTLQAKIDELSTKSDASDRSAIAMRLQLENDLVNARKDLTKTQNDYAYDQTTKSLDQQSEEYKNAKDKELDELDSSYEAQQKVIQDYLGQVKDNYKTVYNTLTQYGENYNISATEDLVSPWDSASSAVDTFQSAVSDAISQINIDLASIDLSNLTELVNTMNGMSGNGGGANSGNEADLSQFEDVSGTGSWQKGKGGKDWYGNSNKDYLFSDIYTIDGNQYAFDDFGYMKTGWDESSGSWRYFDPANGQMVKSNWRKGSDGKDYYLTADGSMATDMAIKAKSGNGYYYVDENGAWDGNTISYDDVKKRNIDVGYRNGTLSTKDELAYMDEEGVGSELMNKQGTLMQFKNGDAVFDKTKTKNLWEFSDNPNTYLKDMILRNQMNLSSVTATNNLKPPINLTFNIDGDNVSNNNLNDFKIWATKELPNIIQQNMGSY